MAKNKTQFQCMNCGATKLKWQGKCDECGKWNTFVEIVVEDKRTSFVVTGSKLKSKKPLRRLVDIQSSQNDRIVTNIGEFNRVMGGGIVRDSVTILSAKPGAGKSTLLLQVAQDVASQGFKVLYASGEESESQIKNRADRILGYLNPNIWVISDISMNHVLDSIEEVDADLIIVDSIQTFILDEYLPSRAGSPTQTMECANELVRIAKNSSKPRAVILIGQMNKSEELAGLRALEHLVDTVLIIDGEDGEELRGITATKNRFGSTGEMSFFSMQEKGMISIENPSEFFMTQREENACITGSALTVVREGTRPIIAEIESLVANSFTPYPSRISESIKKEHLSTLISILEQRGNMNFYNKNVVIKATGGLKLKDHSANLAILMSIVSSAKGIGIPNNTLFIADIGLTGEIKRVPSLESRLKEADRMGYKRAFVANKAIQKNIQFEHLNVVQCNTLKEVMNMVFSSIKQTSN